MTLFTVIITATTTDETIMQEARLAGFRAISPSIEKCYSEKVDSVAGTITFTVTLPKPVNFKRVGPDAGLALNELKLYNGSVSDVFMGVI